MAMPESDWARVIRQAGRLSSQNIFDGWPRSDFL